MIVYLLSERFMMCGGVFEVNINMTFIKTLFIYVKFNIGKYFTMNIYDLFRLIAGDGN